MSNTFEILARGRSAFNGDWYEGDVCYHRNGSVSIHPRENNVTGTGYYVEKETVSPYVQRTDKNGKKVFLGDIVRLTGETVSFITDGEESEILFCVDFFYDFISMFDQGPLPLLDFQTFSKECEVIGNKWDNPELMSEVARDE